MNPVGIVHPGAMGSSLGAALVAAVYAGLLAGGVVRPSSNLGSNLLLAVSDTSTGFGWSKAGFSPEERARFRVRCLTLIDCNVEPR